MHIKRIHCMIEKLTECLEHEVNKGIEQLDTKEFGEVADALSDLCKAEYHAEIVKAMKEEGNEYGENYDYMGPYEDKRYYNHNRYSNGRYAPRGRGRRMGYEEAYYHMTPEQYRDHEHEPEYWRDMDREKHGKMYYTESGMSVGNMTGRNSNHGSMSNAENSRYENAKRNYTETKQMKTGNTVEDKQRDMKGLEELLAIVEGDLEEVKPRMSPEEKTMTKQKLTKFASMF